MIGYILALVMNSISEKNWVEFVKLFNTYIEGKGGRIRVPTL